MGILFSIRKSLKKIGYVSFNTTSKPISQKNAEELQAIALKMATAVLPPGSSLDEFSIHMRHFLDPARYHPLHIETSCLRNTSGGIISITNVSETLTSIPIISIYLVKKTHEEDLLKIIDDNVEVIGVITEDFKTKFINGRSAMAT